MRLKMGASAVCRQPQCETRQNKKGLKVHFEMNPLLFYHRTRDGSGHLELWLFSPQNPKARSNSINRCHLNRKPVHDLPPSLHQQWGRRPKASLDLIGFNGSSHDFSLRPVWSSNAASQTNDYDKNLRICRNTFWIPRWFAVTGNRWPVMPEKSPIRQKPRVISVEAVQVPRVLGFNGNILSPRCPSDQT